MSDQVNESHMVSARLPDAMVVQIDELARRQHNSRSGVVKQALDWFFSNRPEGEEKQDADAA